MKFSDSSTSAPSALTGDLYARLVGVTEELLAAPVAVGSLDEGVDVIRVIGAAERALEAVRLQVCRQIDGQTVKGLSLSAEDVLATAGKLSGRAAKRAGRRAHIGDDLPRTGMAGERAQVGAEHLDAVSLTRWKLRHHPAWQSAFDALDAQICAEARLKNIGDFRRWLRDLSIELMVDDDAVDIEAERARNRFRIGKTPAGRFRGSFDLDALSGEQVRNLVRAASRSLATQRNAAGVDTHHGENLDAEAFMNLLTGVYGAGRPVINAIVDLETLTGGPHEGTVSRTDSGTELPVSVLRRYLCDSWLRHVGLGADGVPLAVGRAYRTATGAQRAALAVMYETCACCETPFADCEIHHLVEWEHGGLTDLNNLIPLCHTHHHHAHEGGWTLRLEPGRKLRMYAPDGHYWATHALPSKAMIDLRRANRKRKRNCPIGEDHVPAATSLPPPVERKRHDK